jgi:hypothetical protein
MRSVDAEHMALRGLPRTTRDIRIGNGDYARQNSVNA